MRNQNLKMCIFRLFKTVKLFHMRSVRNIFLSIFLITTTSLNGSTYLSNNGELSITSPKKIVLIPLGKVTDAFIKESFTQLKNYVSTVELRKAEPMPRSAYYRPRARYRADKLLDWLRGRAKPNEIWIGITMNDISTTKGTYYDYGVMGLGSCPGQACVASNHRVRNKKYFFKVMIHELGHTTGLPHCPVKTCYMTDADGGDPTANENGFCDKCKKHLIGQGWNLR